LESLLLAIGGSVAGLAISRLLVTAALRELPRQLPGANAVMLTPSVPLDGRVVAFAFGTCLLTAFFVGMAPGVQAMNEADLLSSLTGSVVAPRQSRSWLRRVVLVPQIGLPLVLLLVTGVFVRSPRSRARESWLRRGAGRGPRRRVARPRAGWNTDAGGAAKVSTATLEIIAGSWIASPPCPRSRASPSRLSPSTASRSR
jgi:hypothetical protein